MKSLLFLSIFSVLLFSCKKDDSLTQKKTDDPAWYRALVIGSDTAVSASVYGRAVTYQYKDGDDYLQIQLLGYSNGQLVLAVTNPQSCDVDFQLDYDGISPTAISPNRKNSLTYNTVKGHKTETFYITAPKHVGKIKAKALTVCHWVTCDPVWLYVDVSLDILPIVIADSKLEINGDQKNFYISVENPEDINIIQVQKLDKGVWIDITSVKSDKVSKIYLIFL